MQNRREFVGTSIAVSASVVAGAPVVSALLDESGETESLFLGRSLKEWLDVWRSGAPDVWAARAVVAFGPRAVPALLEMLPHKGPPLPTPQLALVIAKIAGDHPQVIDQLLAFSRSDFFRATEVLKRCCGKCPTVVHYFLHILLTEDCLRKQAIALNALGYDCDRSEFIQRTDFAEAVSRFIDRAVLTYNEETDEIIRHGLESAWELIADLNCPAAEKHRLCELLIQTSARDEAASFYLDPAILDRLGPPTSPVLMQFATSSDTRHRDEEIERLIDAAVSAPNSYQQFAQLIHADDEDVAIRAVRRAESMRLDSPTIVEALVQSLGMRGRLNWRRRHVAGKALARLGSKALPSAMSVLAEECPEIRRDAIHLFCQLGSAAQSALPALRFHWYTGDPRLREPLLWAMIAISPDEWLLPFIHEGLEAWLDPDLCAAAVSGLYQFSPLDNQQFLSKLLKMLTCCHHQIQELAAQSISRCGHNWLPEVLKLLDSPDPLSRVGAVLALGNCPPPAPDAVLSAVQQALGDPDLAVQHQATIAMKQSCDD